MAESFVHPFLSVFQILPCSFSQSSGSRAKGLLISGSEMSASSAVPRCHGVKGFSRLLAIATHFRITDGSAASCNSPDRVQEPLGRDLRDPRREQLDRQREMGEAVAHLAGRPPGGRHRRQGQRLVRMPGGGAPVGAGQFRHARRAIRPPAAGAAARGRARPPARNARRGAAAARGLAARRGSSAAMPAAGRHSPPSTGTARRPGRPGCTPWHPGRTAPGRNRPAAPRHAGSAPSRSASRRSAGLARGQRRGDREQPRHHALDIAVHRHRRHVEGDRADRRGRCSRRSPAARPAPPGRAETRRPPPPPARRRAGCGRGRSSLGLPRRTARRPTAPRPAPRRWGSGLRSVHSRESPPPRWSAAA